MLADFKQYFYNPVCFHCGSFFVEDHLFCETCFEKGIVSRLELKARSISFEEKKIPHYYLFEWVPGESDSLSHMVYQLKSDRCQKAQKYYARVLAQQLILQNKLDGFSGVVPMPGSKPSSVHALIVAEEIGKNFKIPMWNILRKTQGPAPQKKRSLMERKQTLIQVESSAQSELFTNSLTIDSGVLFVDDILTTGNTLKAAMKAIPQAQSCCVLTLFYRPEASKLD